MYQPLRFILGHLRHGNARPHGDNLRHLFFTHSIHAAVHFFYPFCLAPVDFLLQFFFVITQSRGAFKVFAFDCAVDFTADFLQSFTLLLHIGKRDIRFDAHSGGRFVNQIKRLIGQKAVGNIPCRILNGRFDGRILDLNAMMRLIAFTQSFKNCD